MCCSYSSDTHSLEISPDYFLDGTSAWDHSDFPTPLRTLLTPIVRPPYWLKLSRLIADWASTSLSISTVPQPVLSPVTGSFVKTTEKTSPNARNKPSMPLFINVRGILPMCNLVVAAAGEDLGSLGRRQATRVDILNADCQD